MYTCKLSKPNLINMSDLFIVFGSNQRHRQVQTSNHNESRCIKYKDKLRYINKIEDCVVKYCQSEQSRDCGSQCWRSRLLQFCLSAFPTMSRLYTFLIFFSQTSLYIANSYESDCSCVFFPLTFNFFRNQIYECNILSFVKYNGWNGSTLHLPSN